jgi:alpha-L-fucosidase 2
MLTHGATIDFEIIYALFTRTACACRLLREDFAFAETLINTIKRLPPLRISKRYGIICEWIEDYEEVEPGHRHISPLFGLYPSDQISEENPSLYEAAKRTIERRLAYGGEGQASSHKVGWSQAWLTNFFARLKDGENALERVNMLLSHCTADNLMDKHPPTYFQIEGNLGGVAGITEMLIQSHLGSPDDRIIELLPALPSEWKTGSISGVKARGGFIFDIFWKDHHLTEVRVASSKTRFLKLKLPEVQKHISSSHEYSMRNGIIEMFCNADDIVSISL